MFKRLGLYGLTTFSLLFAQVASVPLLIDAVGPDRWAKIVAAQALGAIIALIAQFGWPITGPSEVAMATRGRRSEIFAESVAVRLVLVTVLSPVTVGVCLLLVGRDPSSIIAALSSAAVALSPGWFFVGAGRPGSLLAVETIPRVVGTIGGAVAVNLGAELWVFPAALLTAALFAFLGSLVDQRPTWVLARKGFSRPVLRSQLPGAGQSVISTSYRYLPLLVVTALSPGSAVASFALADRFLRLGLAGMRPITQVIQGWVPSAGSAETQERRARFARRFTLAVGSLAVLGFSVAAPVFGSWLSHGSILIGPGTALFVGLAFGLSIVSLTSGLVLMVMKGLKRYLITGSLVGAGFGLVSIVPLVAAFGALGAAIAVAGSELSVQLYQTWRLRRGPRIRRHGLRSTLRAR